MSKAIATKATPAKTVKARVTYKGKHPHRVNAVWSSYGLGNFWCTSNDGARYVIDGVKSKGVLPKIGEDAPAYCILQDDFVDGVWIDREDTRVFPEAI